MPHSFWIDKPAQSVCDGDKECSPEGAVVDEVSVLLRLDLVDLREALGLRYQRSKIMGAHLLDICFSEVGQTMLVRRCDEFMKIQWIVNIGQVFVKQIGIGID